MPTRTAVLAVLVAAAVATTGCGERSGGGMSRPGGEPEAPAECDTGPVELESGLVYEDVRCGDGATAESGLVAVVHYTGRLEDGTQFGSSRGHQPFAVRLGSNMVIPGWEQGIPGMKVGGIRKLTIPPELGYGSQGQGPIPPDSTLLFEVELLEVRNP